MNNSKVVISKKDNLIPISQAPYRVYCQITDPMSGHDGRVGFRTPQDEKFILIDSGPTPLSDYWAGANNLEIMVKVLPFGTKIELTV
jgi:hypothetical protein